MSVYVLRNRIELKETVVCNSIFFLATSAQPKPPLLPASNNVHDSLTSAPETLSSADKKSEVVGGRDGLVPMDTSVNSQPKDTVVKSEPPDSVSKEKKKKKKHKQHRGTCI